MIISIINPSQLFKAAHINYLDGRFHVLMARLNTPSGGSTLEEQMIWLIPFTGIETNYAGRTTLSTWKKKKKTKGKFSREMKYLHSNLYNPLGADLRWSLAPSLVVFVPDYIGSTDSFGKSNYILHTPSSWLCSRLSLSVRMMTELIQTW